MVNYTMWGMTKVLCSDQLGINAKQKLGAWIRNQNSPDRADQEMMAQLGEKYGEIVVKFLKDSQRYRSLARKYQAAVRGTSADVERFYQQLPEDLRKSPEELALTKKIISGIGGLPKDNDVANPIFFPELRQMVATHEESSKRVTRVCDAVCTQKLTDGELRQINSLKLTDGQASVYDSINYPANLGVVDLNDEAIHKAGDDLLMQHITPSVPPKLREANADDPGDPL